MPITANCMRFSVELLERCSWSSPRRRWPLARCTVCDWDKLLVPCD